MAAEHWLVTKLLNFVTVIDLASHKDAVRECPLLAFKRRPRAQFNSRLLVGFGPEQWPGFHWNTQPTATSTRFRAGQFHEFECCSAVVCVVLRSQAQNSKLTFASYLSISRKSPKPHFECPLICTAAARFGLHAGCHQMLLTGVELDHRIATVMCTCFQS